jgi:SpoVK/Ycf46/Vps4 family AAA+-type ATPase
MDDAFTRRIQFIVEFPFPDEQERKRIWEVLFPPGVPRSDDIDFDELGYRFRLTGGSIRNVIISASFLAASDNQSVSNHHLIHAIRREMQKMGRLVNDKDLVMPQKEGNNGKNSK